MRHRTPLAPRLLAAAAACLGAGLATAAAAPAFNFVPIENGESWGVNDAAAPRVDTGSIRSTRSNALTGFGGIRVRVSGGPEPRFNGELMRGFGLRFDGLDSFETTQAVDLGGVSIARDLLIRRTSTWARWTDSFTNTLERPMTVEVVFGGQTGTGSGAARTSVVSTSSGDTEITSADAWVVVGSGTPSVNGPSAVVAGGLDRAGNFLRDPFDVPLAADGHEGNFRGYEHRFTLRPGETRTLVHFVVIGLSETRGLDGAPPPAPGTQVAQVRARAEELAAEPPLGDLSEAERCAVENWTVDALGCADVRPLEQQPRPSPVPPPSTTISPYDVVGKSLGALQADMAAGRTTSQEITRAYLDRIAAYDTGQFGFNAFTTIARDAMAQARRADEARAAGRGGALLGIPVAVKDLFDTRDMPTMNGSLVFEGFRPQEDAWQVARLREAGAVILGKASMEEYAQSGSYSDSAFGQVWNAFDPSKSSIASSGGSAVAVAASFSAAGLGSQTGDSLYGPATAASLFTLRGTDGMQSASGVMPLVWLQDYPGAMTRTVSDLADVLNVTSGTDPEDPQTAQADRHRPADWRSALAADALEGARIGWYPSAWADPNGTTGTLDALRAQWRHLEDAGAEIAEIPAPPSGPSTAGLGDRIYEGWRRYIDDHPELQYRNPEEIIASQKRLPYRRIARYTGTGPMTPTQVRAWKDLRLEYQRRLGAWMDEHDVDAVLYPGLLSPISLNDGSSGAFGRRDTPSGGAGVPTVAMPAGTDAHGEPISLQLLGRAWDDAALVGYAYAFERRADGHVEPDTVPPLRYDADAVPRPIERPAPIPPVSSPPPAAPGGPSTPSLMPGGSPAAARLTGRLARTAPVRGGRARVRVRNTSGVTVRARVVLRRTGDTLGAKGVRIRAGRTRTVRVRVRRAPARATAAVRLSAPGSEPRWLRRTIRLR